MMFSCEIITNSMTLELTPKPKNVPESPSRGSEKLSGFYTRFISMLLNVCVLCFQVQRSQDRAFQSTVTVAEKKYRSSLWSVCTFYLYLQVTLTLPRPLLMHSMINGHFQGEVEEICRASSRHRLPASPGDPGGSYRRGRLRPGLQEEKGGGGERRRGPREEQEATRSR